MKPYIHVFCTICIGLCLVSCKRSSELEEQANPIIAKVSDYSLHLSELSKVLSPGLSSSDSLAISNAFIEKWIREQLWKKEASKHIKSNERIDKLVESYKSSLLKVDYENQLIDENLDTLITGEEYQRVYEQYKGQFELEDMIINGWFAKIPSSHENQLAFFKAWKKNDLQAINDYCASPLVECALMPEKTWKTRKDLAQLVSAKLLSSSEIKTKNNYRKSDKTFNYYLKYRAYVDKNELPPLEFIKEELKRVIIHKRKEKIIAVLTEEMYELGIQRNQIQVFTNNNK